MKNLYLPERWVIFISWGVVVIYLSPQFGTAYSPDSFGYYLLGKNFVSGLGYVSQSIRDFYAPLTADFFQASQSFPPLLPIFIGVVDKATGLGISSGLIVNLTLVLALFFINYLLSKRMAGPLFWMIFLALPFYIYDNHPNDSFLEEIVSGRSIPMTLFFILSLTYILCNDQESKRDYFIAGILLGLLYLTRMDTLLFSVMLIGYLMLQAPGYARWVIYGFSLTSAPWFLRNGIIFGNPFASSNAITTISTFPSIVHTAWFKLHVPTLKDNPSLWLTQRVDYFIANINIIWTALGEWLGFIVVFFSVMGLCIPRINLKIKRFNAIVWMIVLSNLFVVSLTPYHQARYFSISIFMLNLSALLTIIGLCLPTNYKGTSVRQPWMTMLISAIMSIGVVSYYIKPKIQIGDRNSSAFTCIYNAFKTEISADDLVTFERAEHLAYYSTWRTIYLPNNVPGTESLFDTWKNTFNVRYAIVPETSWVAKRPNIIIKKRACDVLLIDLAG